MYKNIKTGSLVLNVWYSEDLNINLLNTGNIWILIFLKEFHRVGIDMVCLILCTRPTIWILDQLIRNQDLSICLVFKWLGYLVFKWHLLTRPFWIRHLFFIPLEYQTSWNSDLHCIRVFGSPTVVEILILSELNSSLICKLKTVGVWRLDVSSKELGFF